MLFSIYAIPMCLLGLMIWYSLEFFLSILFCEFVQDAYYFLLSIGVVVGFAYKTVQSKVAIKVGYVYTEIAEYFGKCWIL